MFNEFMNKYLGKSVDVDGMYGSQCVDLFNAWNRDYNNTYISCYPSGYARSLAENDRNNGILDYFVKTEVNNMIEGTVVVYGKCNFAPVSHVCFFIKDNGNGTYKALQQNDKNRQWVTIDNNPYNGIIGAYIPKQLVRNNIVESKKSYINIPPTIEARNVYYLDKNVVKGQIKPKKFGGLTYTILENNNGYATIETTTFGKCRVKITGMTPITNNPQYEYGNW